MSACICYYVSCTVHQAKGREWDRVKLGNDFDKLLTSATDKLREQLKQKCACNKMKQQQQQQQQQQLTVSGTAAATVAASQSVQFTASSQVAANKCDSCTTIEKELQELKGLSHDHWRQLTPSELREQAACVLFVALTRAKRELKLNSEVDAFLQWVQKRDTIIDLDHDTEAYIDGTANVQTQSAAAAVAVAAPPIIGNS
jgi:superfamily I DNA/RNA helicase